VRFVTDSGSTPGKGAPAPWALKATPPAEPAPTAVLPAVGGSAPEQPGGGPRRRRGALLWAALAVVLIAAGVGVGLFLTREDASTSGGESAASSEDVGSAPFGSAQQFDADRSSGSGDEGGDAAASPSVRPTPSAEPSGTASGDLGLGVPMSTPACDGSFMVFLGAATDPAAYAADVRALMSSRPGAMYTLTRGGCSSMRQQLDDGSLIYAVYVGPYPDQATACAARSAVGGSAYVKRMDNSTPATQLWQC
jgi:serine/threonine-protein kinase